MVPRIKHNQSYLLTAFFVFNLIFHCSSESIHLSLKRKLEEYGTETLNIITNSLGKYSSYKLPASMEYEFEVSSLNEDLKLPKCLSFRDGDGECENVHSFYKNIDTRQTIQLDNIVFIVFIYNDESVDELLKAHFDTWMGRLGEGTDVIFVTDEDDPRSFEEILPDADKARCNLRIYKSPAKKEGSRLRYKVADTFQHVSNMYYHDTTKEYFIKIDTDTYVLPVALMDFIRKIDQATNPQPVLFGRQRCSYPNYCYAAGPLYGMNKVGFNAVAQYFAEHDDIFDEVHLRKSGKGNLMEHEDFMASYAFRQATNHPIITDEKINTNLFSNLGYGSEGSSPICYHRLKTPELFYVYDKTFFSRENLRTERGEIEKIWNKVAIDPLEN